MVRGPHKLPVLKTLHSKLPNSLLQGTNTHRREACSCTADVILPGMWRPLGADADTRQSLRQRRLSFRTGTGNGQGVSYADNKNDKTKYLLCLILIDLSGNCVWVIPPATLEMFVEICLKT